MALCVRMHHALCCVEINRCAGCVGGGGGVIYSRESLSVLNILANALGTLAQRLEVLARVAVEGKSESPQLANVTDNKNRGTTHTTINQ